MRIKNKDTSVVHEWPNCVLECKKCGSRWAPMLRTGGKLPRNFSKCPNHTCTTS